MVIFELAIDVILALLEKPFGGLKTRYQVLIAVVVICIVIGGLFLLNYLL